ncbi:MAG: hypothetical protein AAF810_07490 [Cyanobacteria bacterium P01_D01_bin.36]
MPKTMQTEPTSALAIAPVKPARRFRLNSFAVRLFSMIMGGAILSIGGVAFLFAETVKFQAEDQITKVLEGKVNTVHEATNRTENLAYSLGVSVSTLHVRGAETAGTYQELTRQLFESHPSYILGIGFGQRENGVLPQRDWFYPYYQVRSAIDPEAAQDSTALSQTAEQAQNIRYRDRAQEPYFYQNSEAYRNYFLPQQSVWTTPYQSSADASPDVTSSGADASDLDQTLLTYYSQIFDDQNEWLGTVVIDVDNAYFRSVLDEPVFNGGGKLVLLTNDGQVIANPASGESVIAQTYADVPGLNEIWSQVSGEGSGLIEGEGGYWSYIQIPDQSWVVLAYVPYWVVFSRIVTIALGAVILAGLLMAGVTALAIRYLNSRLRPVINECQRLSVDDAAIAQKLVNKDDLAQLSISFFNLLEQLQLTQTQVQLEAAHATEVETQLTQIKNKSVAQQQRQKRATKKLATILPQADELSIEKGTSVRSLQQELAQLNGIVSTLATDDWLVGVLTENVDEMPTAADMSEMNQVSRRLSHTFVQVLSALNHFSQLLSAFGDTREHLLFIEQKMLSAKRDVSKQSLVVDKLQQWTQNHMELCRDIAHSAERTAADNIAKYQNQKKALLPAATTFRETTEQLSEQLRSLFAITENVDKKNRQYERISNVAKVLILDASTLSISASRQQDPRTFEKIVDQFREKSAELNALSQQLDDAKAQQHEEALQIGRLIADLKLNVGIFEQISQQQHALIAASMSADSLPLATHSKDRGRTESKLLRQATALDKSLQELRLLTAETAQHIVTTLQETSEVKQIRLGGSSS